MVPMDEQRKPTIDEDFLKAIIGVAVWKVPDTVKKALTAKHRKEAQDANDAMVDIIWREVILHVDVTRKPDTHKSHSIGTHPRKGEE